MVQQRDPGPVDVTDVTSTDRVVARLRASGGRITAARRVTIEVLMAGGVHRHLNAEDVAAQVRARLPDVAESTIYRTLAALEALDVVTHVHLGHGPSTFHLKDQAHRHLVCGQCQAISEVPSEEFVALSERLEAEYGFSISNEHFALVGECGDCRARRRAQASRPVPAPAGGATKTPPPD